MPARDTTAPVANITSPAAGATILTPTVSITGTGVDGTGVTSLKLYVNNTLVASGTYAASKNTTRSLSYTYTFPNNGTYTILCEARDAANNLGTKSITVIKSSTTTTTSTTAAPVVLPSSFILKTPPVMDQGSEGSCGSMATYVALSSAKYYKLGSTSFNNSTNVYSPEFLYDLAKFTSDCGSGSSPTSNLDSVARQIGVCFYNTLPYSYNPVGCQTISGSPCDSCIITTAMYNEAATQKITSYFSVPTSDLTGIKQAMYVRKTPLIFSATMDSSFYNSTCGFIWNHYDNVPVGPHIMAIIGWDDAKQALLVQNSYGVGWGCSGFVWIDYTYMTQVTFSVYGVTW